MGRGISADPKELQRFLRDLKKFNPELAKVTRKRFRAAINPVVRDAQRRAPKRSRRLERSIRARYAGKMGVALYSRARYSAIHEYGGRHKVFGRDEWVTQKARPYMRPAAIAGRAAFFREANEAVVDASRQAGWR